MSKRMKIALLITLVVFGGLVGAKLLIGKMMNKYFDNMPVPPAVVTAGPAVSDTWINEVTSIGSVVTVQGADLTTEVGGIIDHIYVESGAEVQAGEIILTLASATDRAELTSLQAAEHLAELDRDRLKSLLQRKTISKAEFDQRESALAQAQALSAAQQARIDQKTLRAPYAGRLGIRRVNIGQYVEAGFPMIGLQALDPVFVDFTLPEQRFSEVTVGMEVRAQVDVLGASAFTGKITAIEPVVNTDTRNFNVQATFTNADEVLRPGMFARVALNVGEQHKVVVVPRTAISFSPYGNTVFVLTETAEKSADGKPLLHSTQRFVRTGESRGDLIAIEDGLKEGEVIATTGLLKLRSGAAVIVNNSIQPDANIAPTPDNG